MCNRHLWLRDSADILCSYYENDRWSSKYRIPCKCLLISSLSGETRNTVCYCQYRWLSLDNRCVVDIYGCGSQLIFRVHIMKMIPGRVNTEYHVSVLISSLSGETRNTVCYSQSRWLSLDNRCVVDIYGCGTQLIFRVHIMKMIPGRVNTEYHVSVLISSLSGETRNTVCYSQSRWLSLDNRCVVDIYGCGTKLIFRVLIMKMIADQVNTEYHVSVLISSLSGETRNSVCYCQSRWLSLDNRCVIDIYGCGTKLIFCVLIMKMIAGRVNTEYHVSVL